MGNSDSKSKLTSLTEPLIENPLLTDKKLINQQLIYEVQKKNPSIEIINELLNSGADPNYKDENGNTALKNNNINNYEKLGSLRPPPPFPIPPPKKGGKKRNRKTKKNKKGSIKRRK